MPAPVQQQNPNDGTQLGTGEIISDETADPSLGCRLDPNLPQAQYKIPRSKIAVGVYGQDGGDATPDRPLATESKQERLMLEQTALRERVMGLQGMQRYAAETISLADARGNEFTTRGVR